MGASSGGKLSRVVRVFGALELGYTGVGFRGLGFGGWGVALDVFVVRGRRVRGFLNFWMLEVLVFLDVGSEGFRNLGV